MKCIFMFIIAMMMFTVNVCADSSETEEESNIVSKYSIGDGITVYKNSEGKWGAYSDNFYLEADYYLPCDDYYFDTFYAYNGVFTLASNESTKILSDNPNTYYIFNKKGELIKTLTYTIEDIQKEKPCGIVFSWVWASGAIGSNIIFGGYPAYYNTGTLPEYIKRLYSEQIAGEDYYAINVYPNVGFAAREKETGVFCALNADGTFREYIPKEEMYNSDGYFKRYPH